MYDKDQLTMLATPDDKGNIFKGSVADDEEEIDFDFAIVLDTKIIFRKHLKDLPMLLLFLLW